MLTSLSKEEEEELAAELAVARLRNLVSDESLRRKLQSALQSRELSALQQTLKAAQQHGLRCAEVERAKQLLDLLSTALPTSQVHLYSPDIGKDSGIVPSRQQVQQQLGAHTTPAGCTGGPATQPQVHAAQGSTGGGASPAQPQVHAASSGSSGSPPTQPQSQLMPQGPGGPTAAMMQHAAVALCDFDGVREWMPGVGGSAGPMQLRPQLKKAPEPQPQNIDATFSTPRAPRRKCWCDNKRMSLDKSGRPLFYKCVECTRSSSCHPSFQKPAWNARSPSRRPAARQLCSACC